MIPESPREDAESGAELRLFERLRDDTSDELVAFHSVAWLVPSDDGRPREDEKDLKPDAPREIVVDAGDLSNLNERIEQLFRYWKGKSKLPGAGRAGMGLLEKLLANDFELRRPLALELETEERDLLRLTE